MVCVDCPTFADQMSLLERHVPLLEQLNSANVTLDVMSTPEILTLRPDNRPVSDNTGLVTHFLAATSVEFLKHI